MPLWPELDSESSWSLAGRCRPPSEPQRKKHNSVDAAHLKHLYYLWLEWRRDVELFTPTMTPSILKPSVDVELVVSLHWRYLHLVTAFCACSSADGAEGSTFTIFWYMSLRRGALIRALISSSSWYVLKGKHKNNIATNQIWRDKWIYIFCDIL